MAINGSPLDGPADCTLACDEGHLTAHKILLCAHSKYLLDILSNFPEAEHPIIILTEINIIDIRILVNYMYTGELTITNDCSPSNILRAAKILRIESLTDFEDEDDSMGGDSLADDDDSPQSVTGCSPPPPSQQHHHNHHQQAPLQPTSQTQQAVLSTVAPTSIPTAAANAAPTASKHPKRESYKQHTNHSNNNNNNNTSNNNNNNISTINNNNKIRCHLCNIGLSDVKCLYRHVLTRHLSEKWGYKCEFCDREFSRDDHLMRHYTTKHKNMEFNREKIRETRRLNREMAKNYHDQISKIEGSM